MKSEESADGLYALADLHLIVRKKGIETIEKTDSVLQNECSKLMTKATRSV